MITWGMSFGSHDAALAVFENNELRFASHSERFSKVKDDSNIHPSLIEHVVNLYGKPTEIFYYEMPWKKRLRYLMSGQFSNIFEPGVEETLDGLGIDSNLTSIHKTDHHKSHAAAGYFTSGYDDASIVVIDAIGEMATLTVWQGTNQNRLKKVYQQNYPHSVGLLYSALAQAVGYQPNREEYIFMGLSAYGNPSSFVDVLEKEFVEFHEKGNLIRLKHNLHRGCSDILTSKIGTNFFAADLAAGAQKLYEKCLQHILSWVYKNLPSRNLVLMGGCALNCVANSCIRDWNEWKNVWIMPNPGDAGSAIGAVLTSYGHTKWTGPYLGYDISGEYPVSALLTNLERFSMVGVANGRAEFGPRALGNRSLFADPRIPHIKDQMNHLKKRERFRPFAAVIPSELASTYFDMKNIGESPYMQYTVSCKNPQHFQGITHVDGTSRIQTVNKEQHRGLHALLLAWYEKTGCPMLVNTSLNIKNQPLVNDEQDAERFSKLYDINVIS